MRSPILLIVIGLLALVCAAPAQSPTLKGGVTNDFCSSDAACFTPLRTSKCPKVRFGWGDCPGTKKACDWCYGPNGVFAYAPRSIYTLTKLSTGCNNFSKGTTRATKDPLIARWMKNAGGECYVNGRGNYTCSNVDATKFSQQAGCQPK